MIRRRLYPKRSALSAKKRRIICYHGTNITKARKILKEGFRPRTYFAAHLEDALGYGGNHVFEVAFEDVPDNWQFTVPYRVSRNDILGYTAYTLRKKFDNKALRKKIFLRNLAAYKKALASDRNKELIQG